MKASKEVVAGTILINAEKRSERVRKERIK